ncbi:MAG: acryloyl-CoA reductase [Actinomycetota bacterium]|jgi:acrylyl-CoA reductase (NADPH)|nr:acryloyl-CoA reductase [Actinomycetota bacterium]
MAWLAFVATRSDDSVRTEVAELEDSELPGGDVLVGVDWSAVNYKDAMVTVPGNRVARRSPLVPGVDLAGRVLESADPRVEVGTAVVVHGYDLGVARHGGFATRARVPATWVVPLPEGLTTRRAAAIGTAGFTAVLSADKLRRAGVTPGQGRVLVTGASGGVGSMAVASLAHRGYEVVASTGKSEEHDYLRALGAAEVVGRDEIAEPGRVLSAERWAGAVDCVGGETLAAVLRSLRYGGAVAASGLTGGTTLETTVYPFIVRAVSLLGVDSVQTPIEERRRVWSTIEESLPPAAVDSMVAAEVGLHELGGVLDDVLAAKVRGRVLVRPV